MQGEWLSDISTKLEQALGFDARMQIMLEAFTRYGCTSVAYDYSPVALSHDGQVLTPTVVSMVNLPDSMWDLWCGRGYYQIDPVQYVAVEASAPFSWSYRAEGGGALKRRLQADHEPVVQYLRDTRFSSGVTVPIHMANGDFATFTGFRFDPERDFAEEVKPHLAEIGLLGHLFHSLSHPGFDKRARTCQFARLTRRELECLRLSAHGLTAKEIAYRLDRSLATVNLHLNTATHKLGARNRVQAIARAAHYRLLESA